MKGFVKSMVVAFAVSFAAPAFAAHSPFQDVPHGHWAYGAVQQAVDAGILTAKDGMFNGSKTITRYQMAVIVAKMLGHIEPMEPSSETCAAGKAAPRRSSGGKYGKKDLENLEALTIEFADELALLNVKVSTLEEEVAVLKKDVDCMKGHRSGSGISGLFQGRLVMTDDDPNAFQGRAAGAAAATGPISRYVGTFPTTAAGTGERRTFFNVAQTSIGFDRHYDDDYYIHLQLDIDSDNETGFNGGATIQVNEAFVDLERWLWDGDIRIRAGAFALPFQRERNPEMVDYPNQLRYGFRSLDLTISPSFQDQVWEAVRNVGVAMYQGKNACMKWQVGVTNSPFSATTRDGSLLAWKLGTFPGRGANYGDALQSINNNNGGAGNQQDIGFYGWVGDKYNGGFRWDAGYFASGGTNRAAPAVSSPDWSGFQANVGWWGWENWGFMGSYFNSTSESGTTAGLAPTGSAAYAAGFFGFPALAAGETFPSVDSTSISALVNYKFNDDNNVSARYEDISDEFGVGEVTGKVVTVDWNHHISSNSLLQLEYSMPETEYRGAAAARNAAGAIVAGARNTTDVNDDLVQMNYKVRF